MTITRNQIVSAFDDLLTGKRSREEIAAWANGLLKAADAGDLTFDPSSEKERLWRAAKYLVGVDLRQSPKEYLHSTDDFHTFRLIHGI